MTKRIKLTEKQIRKAINEVSYDDVNNANSVNFNLFWDLQNGTSENDWEDGFDNFYNKLENLEEFFESFTKHLNTTYPNSNLEKIGDLISKIGEGLMTVRNYSDQVNSILQRKERQRDNFDDAIRKYDSVHGDEDLSWDEYGRGDINNV